MKRSILLLFCIYYSFSVFGQPELVKEFIPGFEGTATSGDRYNQDESVKLNDELIIFAARGEFGRELYKIDSDGLTLIADLKSGDDGSDPSYLTVFEDKVYFIAEGDQGARIYSTDGTEAGTKIAVELGDEEARLFDFTVFQKARDGKLYFEFDSGLYSLGNGILTQINDESNPISIGQVSNANARGWTLYKSGIAFFDLVSGELKLFSAIDGVIEELADVPYDDGFDDRFAMESFEGGIFFTIDSFDDSVKGEYIFRESNGQVNRIATDAGYHRTEYLGDNACIVSGYKGATYLFNANNILGREINDDRAFSFAGGTWERERVAGGVFYVGAGGTFDDTEFYFIEENTTNATLVHTTDDISTLKSDGSYTFYFAESELADKFEDLDLFAFNHETKSVNPVLTLFDPPFNPDITPLGVINEELYFLGIMDIEVGKELYKIDIGFKTDTKDISNTISLNLATLGNGQYAINSENPDDISIEIRTVNGQLINQLSTKTNQTFEVGEQGLLLFTVYLKNETKTFKVLNR